MTKSRKTQEAREILLFLGIVIGFFIFEIFLYHILKTHPFEKHGFWKGVKDPAMNITLFWLPTLGGIWLVMWCIYRVLSSLVNLIKDAIWDE